MRFTTMFVQSIPFLDTELSIIKGRIDIDLYRKDTYRNQYLLPSSCHSKMTKASIPYSQSWRIVRICTNISNREPPSREGVKFKKKS